MRSATTFAMLVIGLACLTGPVRAQDTVQTDEQVLKAAGLPITSDGLLEFFRKRSLKDGDREAMTELVRKLGSKVYRERDKASKDLILRGPLALPFLKEGLKNGDLELSQRAGDCIRRIESATGPDQPAAAARLLAARKPAGAIPVLFNYIPYADNPWVQEQVLTSLGALTVRDGKVDPLLTAALKDNLAERRAAAVYILAQRGDAAQRDAIRQFLGDANPLVRERAVQGLVGKHLPQSLEESAKQDEEFLKGQKIAADKESLLKVLQKLTLSEADQRRLKLLVAQLGSRVYREREKASKELRAQGTPALVFLQEATYSGDLEIGKRAAAIMRDIQRGPGPALPIAVIRLLARASDKESPTASIRDILAYAPFAEDPSIEDELLNTLSLLCLREVKMSPLMAEAVSAPLPARRAAAAYVLGRVGAKDHLANLPKLLKDASPVVRFRAAQGLAAAKDGRAVPALIALLSDARDYQLWQIEEILQRLAGGDAPRETVVGTRAEARQKAVRAWDKWYQANKGKIDLARLTDNEAHLGLMTVVEYDSAQGRPTGRVWEAGRDGKPRWIITGLQGPMDAQVLPNGRVLIAENSGMKVTERDIQGHVKWEYSLQGRGNPIAAQRLPNGNTFIAMYNQVMEVTPTNQIVYSLNQQQRGGNFYIFSAQKLRNGHVLCMSAQGVISEFDPMTNKDVHTINAGPNGGWCGVNALPSGRYLVATMNNGLVHEIDTAGKEHGTNITYPGAFRALRLPNGHTLACNMNTRKVGEFNRAGQMVREYPCDGRPWMIKVR